MSLKQLRETYNVPAYRGAKVIYTDCSDVEHIGHITSSNGSHISVKFGTGKPRKHHPTWHIEYVDEALGDDK
jgi:hypothetical protein